MSSEELFAPRGSTSARPSFEVALRGYDKRQVDDYVSQVDRMVSTLAAERDRALSQAQDLAAHLEQIQAELTEMRQQPPRVDKASFRDLGPTVDQIIALAEHQAQNITDGAAQRAAEHQAEAERVLSEAQQEAERLQAEGQAAYDQAEAEAQRINEQSAQHVENARAEAESTLEAARAQTEQEVQARRQVLGQLQGELDHAQQQLAQVRQEGTGIEREIKYMQQKLGDVNQELAREMERLENARRAAESAERHAQKVRARVQREAERVAQLAAAAVMAAAERGGETGEYPMVLPVQSPGANGADGVGGELNGADRGPEPSGDEYAGDGFPAERLAAERLAAERAVAEQLAAELAAGDGAEVGPAGGGDPRAETAGFPHEQDAEGAGQVGEIGDSGGAGHPGGVHPGDDAGQLGPDTTPAGREFHPFGADPHPPAMVRELDATQDFPAVDAAGFDNRYVPTQAGPHAGSTATDRE